MAIILDTFTAFGLTLADDKTVTMTWNMPIETREQQSLIKLGTTDLENVNQFKYLGHWMTVTTRKSLSTYPNKSARHGRNGLKSSIF